MKTAIEIKNLTVRYGENKVISGFSHSFEKGRCTAIMGPSGCGKTTLVNAVMGLIPYEGNIILNDVVMSAVFQEDRLCEGMSVMRNLRLTSDRRFTPRDIKNALYEMNLGDIAPEKISGLSGGMKRRIAILRALLAPHNTLILDEPFKGLDVSTRNTVMSYILRNSSDTIILITHDISEADFFNSSIVRLGDGMPQA